MQTENRTQGERTTDMPKWISSDILSIILGFLRVTDLVTGSILGVNKFFNRVTKDVIRRTRSLTVDVKTDVNHFVRLVTHLSHGNGLRSLHFRCGTTDALSSREVHQVMTCIRSQQNSIEHLVFERCGISILQDISQLISEFGDDDLLVSRFYAFPNMTSLCCISYRANAADSISQGTLWSLFPQLQYIHFNFAFVLPHEDLLEIAEVCTHLKFIHLCPQSAESLVAVISANFHIQGMALNLSRLKRTDSFWNSLAYCHELSALQLSEYIISDEDAEMFLSAVSSVICPQCGMPHSGLRIFVFEHLSPEEQIKHIRHACPHVEHFDAQNVFERFLDVVIRHRHPSTVTSVGPCHVSGTTQHYVTWKYTL